jgi:predicted nucleic acid-binding protein
LPVRIIVNDTSCLIDLRKAELLTTALLLPFQFVVALPLVGTELHDFTARDWSALKKRGLQIIDLNPAQVEQAIALKGQFPSLSANDCFSLALSQSTEDAMLLTGDGELRKQASRLGVPVHGVLFWVSDQIERARVITFGELADALERLDGDPLVFLPREEVKKRIEKYRKRGRGR